MANKGEEIFGIPRVPSSWQCVAPEASLVEVIPAASAPLVAVAPAASARRRPQSQIAAELLRDIKTAVDAARDDIIERIAKQRCAGESVAETKASTSLDDDDDDRGDERPRKRRCDRPRKRGKREAEFGHAAFRSPI